MARGVGALNVSVNAHTAQAIKNLRDFSSEARQTSKSAREMAQEFRGNTVADYERKMRASAEATRRQAAEAKQAQRAMVDLERSTDRYNQTAKKQIALHKQINGAMSQLKGIGKAVAVVMVAFEGFEFGQKIRGHIQEIHSWADAWRELKAAVGQGKGAVEEEMDRLAERDKRSSDREARMNEHLAYAKDLAKREDEYRFGKDVVRDRELKEKYGNTVGGDYARRERELAAKEKAREAQQEAYKKAVIDKRHAAEEAERKKKEAEREKERKHEEAKRKAAENARHDAEAIQKLRDRVKDFGKTDLQRDRAELLRTLESVEHKREAIRQFNALDRLEKGKTRLEGLQEDRKAIAGRSSQDTAILDARSAEGWSAIRQSISKNPQLAKFDRLIQLQEEANRIAEEKEGLEASKL